MFLASCGKAYFPIELKTISRSERSERQETFPVKIIPMTTSAIKNANSKIYERKVVDAGDLTKPAKILNEDTALIEKFPEKNDPGPYTIGIGDVINFSQIFSSDRGIRSLVERDVIVKEDGLINIIGAGRIKAVGLTESQLEDIIYEKLAQNEENRRFELFIKQFNSKKVVIVGSDLSITTIPFISKPMYLESSITSLNLRTAPGSDIKIIILRNEQEYVFSLKNLLKNSEIKYRLFPNDKILIRPLNYKNESVLVVGETGAQKSIPINSIQRPTLSDTLFSGTVLRGETSDFSQIYVLRRNKTAFNAYHLDITNPVRVDFASKFEMRPDDIVFVATQPLSLYSRTLSQILGSTGLTLQARDTIRTEIGGN